MVTPNTFDVAAVGRRLAARREELRLDQEELAAKAGLSRAYVSRLERGIVPNPKIGDLIQVAAALGVPVADLTDPPPPPNADDDAHLRRLIEREVGDVATAEELATCIKLMRGKSGADLERAIHVFGVLLRSYPPADRNV